MPHADDLLSGAIDLHVHSNPCRFERLLDHAELARQARETGLRAIVLKSHALGTVNTIPFVRQLVPGIDVFGSISLNYDFGGINPFAVDAALKMGARVIWMPTVDSRHHLESHGHGRPGEHPSPNDNLPKAYQRVKGISIVSKAGELIGEVHDILEMIASAGAVLATGHLSNREILLLVRAAREAGVRIVVDHPHAPFMNMPIELQEKLAEAGALLNFVFVSVVPDGWELGGFPGGVSVEQMVSDMRRLGSKSVVISTDLGQALNPPPVRGLRLFIQALVNHGVPIEDIRTMVQANPAGLLY